MLNIWILVLKGELWKICISLQQISRIFYRWAEGYSVIIEIMRWQFESLSISFPDLDNPEKLNIRTLPANGDKWLDGEVWLGDPIVEVVAYTCIHPMAGVVEGKSALMCIYSWHVWSGEVSIIIRMKLTSRTHTFDSRNGGLLVSLSRSLALIKFLFQGPRKSASSPPSSSSASHLAWCTFRYHLSRPRAPRRGIFLRVPWRTLQTLSPETMTDSQRSWLTQKKPSIQSSFQCLASAACLGAYWLVLCGGDEEMLRLRLQAIVGASIALRWRLANNLNGFLIIRGPFTVLSKYRVVVAGDWLLQRLSGVTMRVVRKTRVLTQEAWGLTQGARGRT